MLSHSARVYFRSHKQALGVCLSHFKQSKFSSALLVLVISIAFSLPIALWMLSVNFQALTHHWPHSTQLSMFVDKQLSDQEVNDVLTEVRNQPQVAFANYISPTVGMQLLEQQTGMESLSTLLTENPLPPVIEIQPTSLSKTDMQALVGSLEKIKGSKEVQVDMQWLLRLDAILTFINQSIAGLMALLCFSIVLIVGNTVRLAVNNRKKEIRLLTLFGSTNAYIRRPFLYFGGAYGFFGALFAWLGLFILQIWCQQSISHIAYLYSAHFHLIGLTSYQGFLLLLLGASLGLTAALVSVNKQIKQKNSDFGF